MQQQTNRDVNFYRTAGFNAYRLGLNSFDCPYSAKDERGKIWLEGYVKAKQSHARPMEVSEKNKPISNTKIIQGAPHGKVHTRHTHSNRRHNRPILRGV